QGEYYAGVSTISNALFSGCRGFIRPVPPPLLIRVFLYMIFNRIRQIYHFIIDLSTMKNDRVCQAFTGASLLRTFYFLKRPLGIVKNVKPLSPQSKWIGSNSVIFLK